MKTPISNLKVAIWMVTYNHEHYVQQSIESVMAQQTTFNFHLFVGEDCSTDGTRQICKTLAAAYPEKMTLVLNDTNLGSNLNAFNIYRLCFESGADYVAMLEGDDYWTDNLKLQKQVDFLEAHPDYEVCFTNINIINEEGHIIKDQLIPSHRRTVYEQKHLPIWAPTLTRVFRNRNFIDVLPNVPSMDMLILLYQSKFGKIRFLNEVTGTYRMHGGGIYSSQLDFKRKEQILITFFESLKLVDSTLYPKYFGMIIKKLIEIYPKHLLGFENAKELLQDSYLKYKRQLSRGVSLKMRLMLTLLSSSAIMTSKTGRTALMKLANVFFIYKN